MSEQVVIAPQEGAQEIAFNSTANVIIYGGAASSGKSHLALMHPLPYYEDPNFNGIYFRRVTKQLTGAGGLWAESKKMYRPFGTRVREQVHEHIFPSGATLAFSHMEHEKNAEDHQGLQYSFICFDELTHFTEYQFTYLLSRLRSEADMDSYCLATCNPDADSWVLKWVNWWLDDEGYPDKAKRGKVRYYVVVDDKPIFSSSQQELMEEYPEQCKYTTQDGVEMVIPPKSITFIGGTIEDNPISIKKNPAYLAELNSLNRVSKARLLYGNWYAREEGSSYFAREWLENVASVPPNTVKCRAWDKAGSIPSETYQHPDYTASIRLEKDVDGIIYIIGDYDANAKDDKTDVYGRFRRRAGERDKLIQAQAELDGTDVTIIMAKDSGQAGQTEYLESAKKLMNLGFVVKPDPMANNKTKVVKFSPFVAAAENGLIKIVPSTFPNKETLDSFLTELEQFNGERSTSTRKDD